MKIPWNSLGDDCYNRIMRDSLQWTKDDALLFDDEFIDWVENHSPSLRFIDDNLENKPTYEVKNITEGEWRKIRGNYLSMICDESDFLLFKLTWL